MTIGMTSLLRLSCRARVYGASFNPSPINRVLSQSSQQDGFPKSAVPTDYFQKTLPRLPVPRLEDTCRRYLDGTRSLVTEDQWLTTCKAVKEFLNSDGIELHKELLYRDNMNQHTSYVAGYWADMYLQAREPLMYNFSVSLSLKDDPNPDYQHQLIRAGNFIVSTLKFMKLLEKKELEPYTLPAKPSSSNLHLIRYLPQDVPGSSLAPVLPLDMSQFSHMFKGTRIPCPERDELPVFPDSKHIVVLHNGHIYAFDVLDRDGNIVPPQQILQRLHHIKCTSRPPPSHPVSVLTADNRDFWMNTRNKLLQLGNGSILSIIDSAIIMINLDGPVENNDEHFKSALNGDGFNRWFDKPFNVVVTQEGKVSFLMEHSWGDGISALYYQRSIFENIKYHPSLNASHLDTLRLPDGDASVTKLDFTLTREVELDIEESLARHQSAVESLKLHTHKFVGFGSAYIKSKKISPDAFIQLAYQVAYLRLHDQFAPTYESCTTATYKHGRTETMRPATMPTKRFCEMLEQRSQRPSPGELAAAMSECSALHTRLVGEASMGLGFDRHLFAMRKLAESQGYIPGVFTDPTYMDTLMFRLSTSTVGQVPQLDLPQFAPVVPDGYGIAYSITPASLELSCTSYKEEKDAAEFINVLQDTLNDLHSVLEGRQLQ